jgi:cytochrome oxidase Cu insertion factor (SCO1/SenC/PrrC family)
MIWPMRRVLLAGIAGAMLLATGALVVLGVTPWRPNDQPSKAIGGPFRLTTGDGQTVTDQSFRGKWLLVYFGYTHCPDICPTTLAEISQVLDRLGPLAAAIQPLYITIDPERDTSEMMNAYVKELDSRIIGLTGTPAEIAGVARAYRVYYAKKKATGQDKSAYQMDHSTFVYVMGPDGNYVTLFAPLLGQGVEEMASQLRARMTRAPVT